MEITRKHAYFVLSCLKNYMNAKNFMVYFLPLSASFNPPITYIIIKGVLQCHVFSMETNGRTLATFFTDPGTKNIPYTAPTLRPL